MSLQQATHAKQATKGLKVDTNNSTKTNNKMNGVRRFAIGAVVAVAGLGLAGAGSASAAPANDDAPAVETQAANDVAYTIGAGSPVLVNDFPAGTVSGGYILTDGTGLIEVNGGNDIVITSSFVFPGGGFLQATYGGQPLLGELEMVYPGVYEVALEDYAGFLEIEIPFLSITQVA